MSNAVKKSKICRQSSEQEKAKLRPKCQISNPYISPKWGPIPPPQTKTIFLRVTRAIRCKGQVGVRAPKGGKPTPSFRPSIFFENPSSDFSQKLTQGKRYLKCANMYFGPDLATRFTGKLPTVFGVFGFGGKTPPASRELDHQFSSRRSDVGTAQRARRRARATLPGSGDRLGADTAARNPTSGLTGPEVVFYAIAWPSELINEASQTM